MAKIWYEERDRITVKAIEVISNKLKENDIVLEVKKEDELCNLIDEFLEQFSHGDWKNYN